MNLRNGVGSVMFGGVNTGSQTVMKKGRNSPVSGQLTDDDPKNKKNSHASYQSTVSGRSG